MIANVRLYSSCVPAVRDFQPEWYWTAHRARRGGGSQVSQLSVCFSLLFPFCIMDLFGTAQFCVCALSSPFPTVSVSSLCFCLSPTIKARSSGAVWTRGGTAELSYPIPQLPSTINHYALIFRGHQTSLKNNAKDFERGDLRNIVTCGSCDYLDQSEFCACTTRRRCFCKVTTRRETGHSTI